MSGKPGYHDIGGQPAGAIDPSHRDELPWHKLSVAISNVIGAQGHGIAIVHETRRAREEMGEEVYSRLGYFERATQVTANLLVEKEILTHEEIARRIEAIRARTGGK